MPQEQCASSSERATAADGDRLDLSVVLPVYRNAEQLEALHQCLHQTLDGRGWSYEMVFVDDACPAGSLTVLRRLAERDPRVAVLAMEKNTGQHRAVLTGLSFARGRRMVVMDADLQDPPDAIPPLLAKLDEGFGAVFAGRRGRYESASRLATSRVFKRVLHWVSGVPADAGIFVAISQEMAGRLLAMDVPRPFVVAMLGCCGLPMASIPVERSQRPSGQSAYSSWKRLKTGCLAIAWVIKRKWFGGRMSQPQSFRVPPIRLKLGARFE